MQYRPGDFSLQGHLSCDNFTAVLIQILSLSAVWLLLSGQDSEGQGGKNLEPKQQGNREQSYNEDRLGCRCYMYGYTHTGKAKSKHDDSRALKDTTVDRLIQASNSTI